MTAERLRIAASVLCILAYALVTQGFVVPGTLLNLATNFMFAPFMWQERMWDMFAIEVVYVFVNLAALIA